MTYSAVYEAKFADGVSHATLQRSTVDGLFEALKEQVAVDFQLSSIVAIAIFISENSANG